MGQKVKFDMSENTSFEAIPEGTYTLLIDSKDAQVKQGPSTEYVPLKFKVVGGEHNDRVLFENFPIAGKGIFKIANLMQALGLYDGKSKSVNIDLDKFHGKKVSAIVNVYEYDGQDRNSIKSFVIPKGKKAAAAAEADASGSDEPTTDVNEQSEPATKKKKFDL